MAYQSPPTPTEYAQSLSTRIWTTRGARFEAQRRLEAMDNWSTFTIVLLSVFIAGIGYWSTADGLDHDPHRRLLLGFASGILSIFVLAVSLLENAKKYQLKAHQLHENAVQLEKIEAEVMALLASSTPSPTLSDAAQELFLKYITELDSCPVNHDAIDYDTFRASKRRDFGIGPATAVRMSFVGWLYPRLGFMLLGSLPPLILFLLL